MNVIYQSATHQAKAAGPLKMGRETMTRLDFIRRFTDSELGAIYTAAKTEVSLEIFIDKVRAASDVTVTDPRTVAGVQALADAGLIAQERVAEILSPEGAA